MPNKILNILLKLISSIDINFGSAFVKHQNVVFYDVCFRESRKLIPENF